MCKRDVAVIVLQGVILPVMIMTVLVVAPFLSNGLLLI
jgi:hypothetical protein